MLLLIYHIEVLSAYLLLDSSHYVEDNRLQLLVFVCSKTQVDLSGISVVGKGYDHSEDLIRWCSFDLTEDMTVCDLFEQRGGKQP